MDNNLELDVTRSKSRQGKKSRKANRNRRIDPNSPREQKYIGLRQYHSNNWRRDTKGEFRTLSMVSKSEYLHSSDAEDIMETRGNIDTLRKMAKTKDIAKQEALLRFGAKKNKITFTRNEAIAEFVTGWQGKLPHNFTRYGVEVAKNGVVAESRPNSSVGKVGTTSVTGFKQFNKDYKQLAKSLLKILALDGKKAGKLAKNLAKKIKVTVTG